jgi:hypothetical protein
MTTEQIDAFESAELSASSFINGDPAGAVHIALRGSADTRAMKAVAQLLGKVHDEIVRRRSPEAIVDLRALDFMNSSCFKAFVTWISRVQELSPASRYGICFVSDASKHWQRRSLGALKCFAVDLVRIEA